MLNVYKIYLEKEKNREVGNLGIIIFKPGFSESDISTFNEYTIHHNLSILKDFQKKFNKEAVVAMYPRRFTFTDNDLIYGLDWKKQTIDYLTTKPSRIFLVSGESATKKLHAFKVILRKKHGVIIHPNKEGKMSKKKFFQKVVKNIAHVVDEHEFQNSLWLIFGYKIS